jgi:hypothetical protein
MWYIQRHLDQLCLINFEIMTVKSFDLVDAEDSRLSYVVKTGRKYKIHLTCCECVILWKHEYHTIIGIVMQFHGIRWCLTIVLNFLWYLKPCNWKPPLSFWHRIINGANESGWVWKYIFEIWILIISAESKLILKHGLTLSVIIVKTMVLYFCNMMRTCMS